MVPTRSPISAQPSQQASPHATPQPRDQRAVRAARRQLAALAEAPAPRRREAIEAALVHYERGRHLPGDVRRAVRQAVRRASGGRCVYCADRLADTALTLDHVRPMALGGTTRLPNLVASCQACNSAKGSLPLRLFFALRPQAARSFLRHAHGADRAHKETARAVLRWAAETALA